MALPFLLPSDEDVEENYRRLERLLRDLYHVLHELLSGGAPLSHPRPPHNHQGPPPPPPPATGPAVTVPRGQTSFSRATLPSLFTPASAPQLLRVPPELTVRMPIRKTSHTPQSPSTGPRDKTIPTSSSSPEYWKRLGSELRVIADGFKASRQISVQMQMASGAINISGAPQTRA